MSRWRIILVAVLIVIPLLVLAGTGSYYLWTKGLSFRVWWPLAGCMILGYLLAWYWQQNRMLVRPVDFAAPLHWTPRDQQAWELVKSRAGRASAINVDELVEFQFYVDTAREMAEELARFYHPRAKDPVASLTIPEILAVIELAAHDMSAAPLFVLPETTLDGQGLLSEEITRPLHDWFAQLAADVSAQVSQQALSPQRRRLPYLWQLWGQHLSSGFRLMSFARSSARFSSSLV